MKRWKSVLCAGMAMAVIGSAAAFAGCKPEDKTGEYKDPDIYAIYTKYAEAAGEDALSYDDWLRTVKGEDGATWHVSNGAPANTLGKDDDLCLDSSTFDLYQKKSGSWSNIGNIAGEDGKGAYEAWKALDPENNTATEAEWLASLQGAPGTPGTPGAPGTKWYYDEGAPIESNKLDDALEGDFYLDTSSGKVYCLGEDWTEVFEFGAAGGSSVAPQEGKVTIGAHMPALATVSNVTEGWNYVYIDAGKSLTAKSLWVSNCYDGATTKTQLSYKFASYFIKAQEEENKDKNVYVALLNVPQITGVGVNNTFKFETNGVEITDATITFKPVTGQEFKSGKKFMAPIFHQSISDMKNYATNNFTHFTALEKGKNTLNDYTITLETDFELNDFFNDDSDGYKKSMLVLSTDTSVQFETVIDEKSDELKETDTKQNNNLLNKAIYFTTATVRNAYDIDFTRIMPAYVTLTAPAA